MLQIGCNGQPQDLRNEYFDNENGRFISCTAYPDFVALCYHESKNHAAIVEVHNGFISLFGAPIKFIEEKELKHNLAIGQLQELIVED